MRMLFTMDAKNYAPDAPLHIRPSVRGIVIRDGKVLMVHSRKYDYYKFPGGGIEAGEDHNEALCREVREETGFAVSPNSIREYGMVHRRERDHDGTTFVQDNFYYLCAIGEKLGQELDDYADEEGFTRNLWLLSGRSTSTASTITRTNGVPYSTGIPGSWSF